MSARFLLEVATSIAASLAIASVTTVPLAATVLRTWPPDSESLVADHSTDEDGAAADDWDPLPQPPQRVVAVTHAANPAKPAPAAKATPDVPPPVVADAKPAILLLPAVPTGDDLGVQPADPLAFLATGWGSEPDPTVIDPEDGTADDQLDDNDGLADASGAVPKGMHRVRPIPPRMRAPKNPRPPCAEDNPAIAEIGPGHYEVGRGLVEYYATHPFQFQDIATYVITHKDPAGEEDGFKVGLKRCGVLWEAGFRSGDVVNSVNTRTISTVMQAIGAYLALRSDSEFDVVVSRRGKPMTMHFTLLEETRDQRHERKDALHQERQEARETKREARKTR